MKPESQRIALALIHGWEQCLDLKGQRYLVFGLANIKGTKATGDEPLSENALKYVPDYLNDLDAIREVEHILIFKGNAWAEQYYTWLENNAYYAWHASAALRAEGILRRFNMWVED